MINNSTPFSSTSDDSRGRSSHDLKSHLRALSIGARILDDAVAQRNWTLVQRTAQQISETIDQLDQIATSLDE